MKVATHGLAAWGLGYSRVHVTCTAAMGMVTGAPLSQDTIVTFPDGHETHGLPKHLEDMKAMFVPMPDLAISEHPIKIANGDWTAVVGCMTGTFTKPMPLGNGKFAQPTGKMLNLVMATIGHWTDAGVMDHEWLFWDNQAYMKQLGLAP